MTLTMNRRRGRQARAALSASLAFLLAWLAAAQAFAQTQARTQPQAQTQTRARAAAVAPAWRAAPEQVSAESMRGHLSFISSDALEGRKTPSRGLNIAAEYIAAQFRRAGLEPAGDDGYFQTANWTLSARDAAAFRLSFSNAN